jgi:Cdc6-like AAA superfamily ATPase
MSNLDKLKDMLDNIINGKPEQAEVVFHDYLSQKMKERIGNVGTDDSLPVKNVNNNEE